MYNTEYYEKHQIITSLDIFCIRDYKIKEEIGTGTTGDHGVNQGINQYGLIVLLGHGGMLHPCKAGIYTFCGFSNSML